MPNRLSGRRATCPAPSVSSTVRSTGVRSGSSFFFGGSFGVGGSFGFGVGLAAGFFAAAALSSSSFFGSRGGWRGPGLVFVTASER